MEESLYQKIYSLPLVKGGFSFVTEMVVRITMSDDNECFLGFDKKENDVHMKHCKVLIESIAESKDKKKGMKVEKKAVQVEMMVRRWTKKINKLVMRCFYLSNLTRKGYRKRINAMWREKETFEITKQRLA